VRVLWVAGVWVGGRSLNNGRVCSPPGLCRSQHPQTHPQGCERASAQASAPSKAQRGSKRTGQCEARSRPCRNWEGKTQGTHTQHQHKPLNTQRTAQQQQRARASTPKEQRDKRPQIYQKAGARSCWWPGASVTTQTRGSLRTASEAGVIATYPPVQRPSTASSTNTFA